MGRRSLPPAFVRRALAVKDAHAHLSKTVPGFRQQPGREQLRRVHAHLARTVTTTAPPATDVDPTA